MVILLMAGAQVGQCHLLTETTGAHGEPECTTLTIIFIILIIAEDMDIRHTIIMATMKVQGLTMLNALRAIQLWFHRQTAWQPARARQ
jgi:hypothetical protein